MHTMLAGRILSILLMLTALAARFGAMPPPPVSGTAVIPWLSPAPAPVAVSGRDFRLAALPNRPRSESRSPTTELRPALAWMGR